jgi:hypothetical protein
MFVVTNGRIGYRKEQSWPALILSQNLRGRSVLDHGTFKPLRVIPQI